MSAIATSDLDSINRIADAAHLVFSPRRLEVLACLRGRTMATSDVADELDLDLSTISRVLSTLRTNELVAAVEDRYSRRFLLSERVRVERASPASLAFHIVLRDGVRLTAHTGVLPSPVSGG